MKAELHCHTNISDCPLSIDEVLNLAIANEVSHLAITNHDTTKGLREAIERGKRYGVEVILVLKFLLLILTGHAGSTFWAILSNLGISQLKRCASRSLSGGISFRSKWFKG